MVTIISLFCFVFFIIGGLYLFIQGINLLSSITKKLVNNSIFIKCNKLPPALLVFVGFFISSIIQSSSASISLLIPIIASGAISVLSSFYIVMGFNIGTTSTLVLTGLNGGNLAIYLLGIGILLYFIYIIKKGETLKSISTFILSIGLIFFSLRMIKDSFFFFQTLPLYNYFYLNLTDNFFNPFFVGIFFTALVQSSSIVTTTFQQLYMTSNIDLIYIILIIIGSNIGTTVTGVIAAINTNASGKSVALFHVLFNVIGCLVVLIIIYPFKNFVIYISNTLNKSKGFDIALCHFFFNSITMLVFFPFTKIIYAFLDRYSYIFGKKKSISKA